MEITVVNVVKTVDELVSHLSLMSKIADADNINVERIGEYCYRNYVITTTFDSAEVDTIECGDHMGGYPLDLLVSLHSHDD